MTRELAPCGTEAAYRRHRRQDETPCEDCKRAAAAARKARMDRKKPKPEAPVHPMADGTMSQIRPDLFAGDIRPEDVEDLDLRGELLWIYATLKSAMRFAMPRETASIAKELRGLLTDLTKNSDTGGQTTLEDEFKKAMEQRDAQRAGASAAAN